MFGVVGSALGPGYMMDFGLFSFVEVRKETLPLPCPQQSMVYRKGKGSQSYTCSQGAVIRMLELAL